MKNPLLVTMSGPSERVGKPSVEEYLALDDRELGFVVLSMVDAKYPGITFGELWAKPKRVTERMGGPFDFVSDAWDGAVEVVQDIGHGGMEIVRGAGHVVGEVTRTGGHILAEGGRYLGHAGGEVLRAVTSERVQNFLNSTYSCYTASGGWTAAVTGSDGGGEACAPTAGEDQFLSQLGADFKAWLSGGGGLNKAGLFGIPGNVLPWAIAASAVLVVMFAKPGASK